MDDRVFSISQLTRYLQGVLRQDKQLNDLWVAGEISNFHRHSSGHCYLTLKDEGARLRAVMFRRQAQQIKFELENGLDVLARGNVDIYQQRGEYQLYIRELQPEGMGALHLAFEQLKEKLEKEGLFAEEQKKELPPFPQKIGVVTSSTGAAIKDILAVLKRRSAGTSLLLASARVQGEGAGEEVVEAIEKLSRTDVEVIIVTRGGGSLEELWSFNEEIVARAIFNCPLPVISAVGHERDFTIADFVADCRAPTPSAAAEMVVPDQREIKKDLLEAERRLETGLWQLLNQRKQQLEYLQEKRIFQRPQEELIERKRQHLDDLETRMATLMRHQQQMEREKFQTRVARLEGLNPLKVLGRGYSICTDRNREKVYRNASELNEGEEIRIKFSAGEVLAEVLEKAENGFKEDENGGRAKG